MSKGRATQWPADREVPAPWIGHGYDRRAKHGLPRINLALEAEKFVNHFAATGDSKINWERTFTNWCLSAWHGQPEAIPQKQDHAVDMAVKRVMLALKGFSITNFGPSDVRLALKAKAITEEEARRLGI